MSQYTPDESAYATSLKDSVVVISGIEPSLHRLPAIAYTSFNQVVRLV